MPANQDNPDRPETMLLQANQAPRDHQDHQDNLVNRDSLASQALQRNRKLPSPARQVPREIKDPPGLPDLPVNQAPTLDQAQLDQRDPQDLQARQATMGSRGRQDSPVHQATRERRASAPSTAPSTAACSSKTADRKSVV